MAETITIGLVHVAHFACMAPVSRPGRPVGPPSCAGPSKPTLSKSGHEPASIPPKATSISGLRHFPIFMPSQVASLTHYSPSARSENSLIFPFSSPPGIPSAAPLTGSARIPMSRSQHGVQYPSRLPALPFMEQVKCVAYVLTPAWCDSQRAPSKPPS